MIGNYWGLFGVAADSDIGRYWLREVIAICLL